MNLSEISVARTFNTSHLTFDSTTTTASSLFAALAASTTMEATSWASVDPCWYPDLRGKRSGYRKTVQQSHAEHGNILLIQNTF